MGLLYSLALSVDFLILQDFLNIPRVMAKRTVPLYITLSRHSGEVTANINIHQPCRGHGNRKKVQRGFFCCSNSSTLPRARIQSKPTCLPPILGRGGAAERFLPLVREKPESRAGLVRPGSLSADPPFREHVLRRLRVPQTGTFGGATGPVPGMPAPGSQVTWEAQGE